MDSGLKNVTGIVVGQLNSNQFYAWCKESYPGKDGILTVEIGKSVKIGDWLNMKFTPSEYQQYFPIPKNQSLKPFRTSNFDLIPEIYDTKVDGKTIRIQLELYLLENQTVINHSLFEKIYNNRNVTFPTGKHLVTIRRVFPEPGMESVWGIERVDPVPEKPKSSEVNLIGIVAGQFAQNWYVWSKERPVGKIDILISKTNSTLAMGSWVRMTVPLEYMNTDFLECTKFNKTSEIHPTQVKGNTISLKLKCSISKNSTVIYHPFVGKIINERAIINKSGTYEITIVRSNARRATDGTVWSLMEEPRLLQEDVPINAGHLSRFDQPRNMNRGRSQSRNGRSKMITGIVVAENFKYLFVWCKDRPPARDAKLLKSEKTASLKIGDFIQFSMSEDQKSDPHFEFSDFTKCPPKYETFKSGPSKNTVTMNLELNIHECTADDISHDFVGLIINDKCVRFDTPGRYKLTIVRGKNADDPIRSVWFLKSSELIQRQPGLLSQILIQQQQHNFAQSMENLNLAPAPLPSILKKYSPLQHKTNAIGGSQSDTNLYNPNVAGPAPPPVARRSKSRNRSQSRRRSKSRNRNKTPIPAPRTSLDGNPPQNQTIVSDAIILNIVRRQDQEKDDIHVWIFAKHVQGFLNLRPAEVLKLKKGTVFSAKFTENANGKWNAYQAGERMAAENYRTGLVDNQEIKILVHVKIWNKKDQQHRYLWAKNGDFGEILDKNRVVKAQHGFGLYDHVWIKRSYLNGKYEWIVIDDNNTNSR